MAFTNIAISTVTSSITAPAGRGKCITIGKEAHFQQEPLLKTSKTNSHLTMYIRCALKISEFEDSEKR
jgi:hypothetical protein